MPKEQKRIFVGNLPPDVQEEDVRKQFYNYGHIISIEIKHRKDSTGQELTSAFAFVNIQTDYSTLNKCFRELSDYDWDGYCIKLELAKENFLERLKREREETKSKETNARNTSTVHVQEPKVLPVIDKSIYKSRCRYDSSESNSSDSEQEKKETKPQFKVDKKVEISIEEEKDYVIKNNKFKHLNGKSIKIESLNLEPIHTIKPKIDVKEIKDPKALEAEEKRKKSISLMKNSYHQQKLAIKAALSSVDNKNINNKIIFGENEQDPEIFKKRKNTDDWIHVSHNNLIKKSKISLFDENNEDEHEINFGIKKHFEGQKGHKLLELQSRFTNDKRFTLDARFLDHEEVINNDEPEDDEKQKQLYILESVLGQKIANKKPKETAKQNTNKSLQTMFRFDPSKPEHSKFEIKTSDEQKEKRNKLKEKKKAEETTPDEVINVDVSKEKFYKVTENLKQSLQEKQPFSLLSMLGRSEDNLKKEEFKDQEDIKHINKTKKVGMNRNPFKYDSSDSEDDEPQKNKLANQKETKQPIEKLTTKESSKGSFFFQNNDERLQEGLDFLKKLNNNTTPFEETRRKLKVIVRAKVRNNIRNNRPFRKKLGRNKMIKIKKAKKK